jgi:hypothetical protein
MSSRSEDAEQPSGNSAALAFGTRWRALSHRAFSNDGGLQVWPVAALSESSFASTLPARRGDITCLRICVNCYQSAAEALRQEPQAKCLEFSISGAVRPASGQAQEPGAVLISRI